VGLIIGEDFSVEGGFVEVLRYDGLSASVSFEKEVGSVFSFWLVLEVETEDFVWLEAKPDILAVVVELHLPEKGVLGFPDAV